MNTSIPKRTWAALAIGALLLVPTACTAPRFAYAPVAITSAEVGGLAAATYAIPSDDPKGEVNVVVPGLVLDLRGRRNDPKKLRVLHVSLAVSNHSGSTWRVEPAAQHVELASRRVRVTLDAMPEIEGRSATVDIPPASTRWVDLAFPLPEEADDDLLSSIEVTWAVLIGADTYATHRTRFERLRLPPATLDREQLPTYRPSQPMPSQSPAPYSPERP